MCKICGYIPCISARCPGYEESIVEHCSECGSEILEQDTYYSFYDGDLIICDECIDKHRRTAERDYS